MIKQLFSLQRAKLRRSSVNERGVSVVQSMLVLPVLLMMGAGILHVGLIAQAKSNLEYAALMAARIGASTPNFGVSATGENLMKEEIIKRMVASDARNSEYLGYGGGIVRVCILRPDDAAFNDHQRTDLVPGSDAIPNDNLPVLSQNLGAQSGISIQDANILHLRVMYLFDSNVPFMNTRQSTHPVFTDSHMEGHFGTPVGDSPGRRDDSGTVGTWLKSDAVVVMQSPALRNAITTPYIATRGADINGDGEGDPICPDFPAEHPN